MTTLPSEILTREIARRRTFAIISHPDAGKTTLTEKFLQYGGALHLAGSVTARKNQRATASDWMELEKKRGISISSTVLQFDYRGYAVNLLDTPGHRDFSEDTYRVLTAVDAVIMVIDGGNGVESQTRKLFEICRRREIPIFTYVNKMDRPAKDPIELLDEIENVLGIKSFAVDWPLGMGDQFRGVYDRLAKEVHLFERVSGGGYVAPLAVTDINDNLVRERVSPSVYQTTVEELEILEGAGSTFDLNEVLAGNLTPVFFGSASNNFGVQLLLDTFLDQSSAPRPRSSIGRSSVTKTGASGAATEREIVPLDSPSFSGFVFKIQANMDPRHRDRIAFIRICSGRFTRDMSVFNSRTGKQLRLSSTHKLFGKERETVDEAFAGDIIGVVGHSDLRIGDTLTEDVSIVFDEIPHFAPECFAFLHNVHTDHAKRFNQGLEQLLQEGVVQKLLQPGAVARLPILAAVGPLQFDVVQYRLESEYGAKTRLEVAPWNTIRWIPPTCTAPSALKLPSGSSLAADSDGNNVVLFPDQWALRFFDTHNPDCTLLAERPVAKS